MLAEDKIKLQESFNNLIRKLNLPNFDTEVIETNSTLVAGIGTKITNDGKLKYLLFLGPYFTHTSLNKRETLLGHEAGHLKFRQEHPKLDRILRTLQNIYYVHPKLARYTGYGVSDFLYFSGTLMSAIFLSYVAPIVALPVIANYSREYLATRAAKKNGIPSSTFTLI